MNDVTNQILSRRRARAAHDGRLSRLRARRARRTAPEAAVHFHRGPEGAPTVCDQPRCDRPHLDV